MIGLPVRLNSASTSSYCKSSIRFCSLMIDRSGLVISSAILGFAVSSGGGFGAESLRQLELLQVRLDSDRVLRFGDDLFTRNHPGQIFINQKTIQRNHAVFGPRLDVGLNTKRLIVANEGGDGRRVDHDFKDRHASRLVNAGHEQLRD